MKKEIICTICPKGCYVEVEGNGDEIVSMTGYSCKRGETYAKAEFSHPVRILTTTVKIKNNDSDLLPIRSTKPLPKEKLMDCMEVIRAAEVTLPVRQYQVIAADICGTGIDMVATKAME